MEYILENEKVIEECDGDGGWVDTHHNVDVNTGELKDAPKEDADMKVNITFVYLLFQYLV